MHSRSRATIRLTQPGDAPLLRAIRIEALQNHPLAFTADLPETEAKPAEFWQELATRGGGDVNQAVFLAVDGETPCGMAGIWTPPQPKLAHAGTIWGVYVRESARRNGTGESLIRACVDWARSKSLITVKLSVVVGNDSARRCYERCGFTAYGVEPMAVCYDGKMYDEVLMSLPT
jgi:RimJ/RimL family protein N-acetyltransferase